MKKVLVIDNCYPNEENKYGDFFVHVRLKEYRKEMDVSVVGYSRTLPESFEYEGIRVRNFNNKKSFIDYVMAFDADLVIIHFLEYWMIQPIAMKLKKPLIVWVHGHEVVRWYRRTCNFEFSLDYLKYMVRTEIQSVLWNRLIRFANASNHIHFVFVSNWLKSIAEQDSHAKIKSFSIIPNPVDDAAFAFVPKPADLRRKVLMIRSFATRIHANDIAMKGILAFSRYPEFKDFEFDIYGKGKYWDELTTPLQGFSNIHLNNYFLENKDIPAVHKDHGVFLCVSRQDTQGVSMCEAMSSGLLPLTTGVAGILEYVSDRQTGLFAKTPEEIADALLELDRQPELFTQIAQRAAESVREKCGLKKVTGREMDLIRAMLQTAESS